VTTFWKITPFIRYEEEIARLRQQLELYTNKQPQTTIKQEQPPTIGPASNLFGGIMNASTQKLEDSGVYKKATVGPLEFGTQITSLVDTDPATVPDSFKIDMPDWYAL
jgi:glucose repression regulatory protein TUP1